MPRDEAGILSEIKRDYILSKLKDGKRADGRGLTDYRDLEIETNYVPRAAGSALVKLGKTKIVAGIKIEAGEPFADTPNRGVLTTNVELLPMAFPTFESGPPNENAVEIARVVDRGIRESKMIDLQKLVIEEGKKVWIVFIDIDVIDYDGNLIDACTLGVLSALKTAIVPASKEGGKDFQLPITTTPIAVTMAKVGEYLLVDPTVEEEQLASARITVSISEDGHIRAMQKGNGGSFELDEIKKAIKISSDTGKQIRKKYLK